MHEHLTKATHDATFCANDLQEALNGADAVAALLLLNLIGDARALATRIEELKSAIATRAREECGHHV